MPPRSIASLLIMLLLAVRPALGGEPNKPAPYQRATARDLPPLTPKGTSRVMTQDDATSTSKCIGKPVTPLCAVETIIACFTRSRQPLCDAATHGMDMPTQDMGDFTTYYRVARTEVVTDRRFPWKPSLEMGQPPGQPSVRVGDVRIDLRKNICMRGTYCTGWDDYRIYVVRKADFAWRVIGWGDFLSYSHN